MSLWLHEDPTKRVNVPEEALARIADFLLVPEAWLRGLTRAGAPPPRNQGEVQARYRHGTHAVLIREFMEKLVNARPEAMACFAKTLRVSPEDQVEVDYASNALVLIIAPPRVDVVAIRALLWQALTVRTADEHLGIERHHVIASQLVTESLVREAAMHGILLREYQTADDLADLVLQHESR